MATREEVYFLYIEKWGYPPEQARHLLKFSKSINQKLSWKDAGELVKNPPNKSRKSFEAKPDTKPSKPIESNQNTSKPSTHSNPKPKPQSQSQQTKLIINKSKTKSIANNFEKLKQKHTKKVSNYKPQNINTKSVPQPIKQNKTKSINSDSPTSPIQLIQSHSSTNLIQNDTNHRHTANVAEINSDKNTQNNTVDTDTTNAMLGQAISLQQNKIKQYQQQFPPPPPGDTSIANTDKTPTQNTYGHNGYTPQQQAYYQQQQQQAYWNYYNNPQYAAYYQQQQAYYQQQAQGQGQGQVQGNGYGYYQQQAQGQGQGQNGYGMGQSKIQQYQQQFPPPQQEEPVPQPGSENGNGLKGRDFLGMNVVKQYEQKQTQKSDYGIPSADKPMMNTGVKDKEGNKAKKKKFKLFG